MTAVPTILSEPLIHIFVMSIEKFINFIKLLNHNFVKQQMMISFLINLKILSTWIMQPFHSKIVYIRCFLFIRCNVMVGRTIYKFWISGLDLNIWAMAGKMGRLGTGGAHLSECIKYGVRKCEGAELYTPIVKRIQGSSTELQS